MALESLVMFIRHQTEGNRMRQELSNDKRIHFSSQNVFKPFPVLFLRSLREMMQLTLHSDSLRVGVLSIVHSSLSSQDVEKAN